MYSAQRYSRSASGTNRSSVANHRVTLCSRFRPQRSCRDRRDLCWFNTPWFNTPACPGVTGTHWGEPVEPASHACEGSLGFTPPCGLLSPSFARCVVFPGTPARILKENSGRPRPGFHQGPGPRSAVCLFSPYLLCSSFPSFSETRPLKAASGHTS